MILRSQSTQWAAATQMLPTAISKDQAVLALENFSKAIQLQFQKWGDDDSCPRPPLPEDIFKWKEFRTPTKNLLVALGNALKVTLPPEWSFADCVPSQLLVPSTRDGERISMLPSEKKCLGLEGWPQDMDLKFVYNSSAQTRWPDFYIDDSNLYHLTFSADEGTESPIVQKVLV